MAQSVQSHVTLGLEGGPPRAACRTRHGLAGADETVKPATKQRGSGSV